MDRRALIAALLVWLPTSVWADDLDLRLRWPPRCPPQVEEPNPFPARPTSRAKASDDLEDEELSDDFTAEDRAEDKRVPKFRIEVWGHYSYLIPHVKYKKGPEGIAHHYSTRRDHHAPAHPFPGYRFIFDVKFHKNFLVGLHYDRGIHEGPRRRVHHKGIAIQGRVIPGGTPVRTLIDLQYGDFYFRWVIRDNAKIRLAIGIGAAWASGRVRVRGQGLRTSGRVEAFFAPTVTYYAGIYPVPWLGLFAESSTAVISVDRFPALASNFRAGFRFPFGEHVELAIAGSGVAGQIEDAFDLWGGRPTSGKRWKQLAWFTLSLELGLTLRF